MSTDAQSAGSLLLVDDDDALSQMLAWEFEDLGYRVRRAADCRQAVAAAQMESFDCALIDFHLPDGDGRRLSRRLKRISPQLRIVMMSGDRTGAMAGGPEPFRLAFVDKPVPTARIHRLFGGKAADLRATQAISRQF